MGMFNDLFQLYLHSHIHMLQFIQSVDIDIDIHLPVLVDCVTAGASLADLVALRCNTKRQ